MRIFILGAGHMGTWLLKELCLDHEVAIYDPDKRKLKYFFNVKMICKLIEVKEFEPELVINSVDLSNIQKAFDDVFPYLPDYCILSDIASVKTGLYEYYKRTGKGLYPLTPCSVLPSPISGTSGVRMLLLSKSLMRQERNSSGIYIRVLNSVSMSIRLKNTTKPLHTLSQSLLLHRWCFLPA